MESITHYAQENIVLTLFLVVGLGYLVGKIKLASVALGSTTGVLLVGILVGMLHLEVQPLVKSVFFTLFLFTLGVKIGPGLVNVLMSRASLKYLAMCLFSGTVMAITLFLTAKLFGLSNIVTGGLAAGSMTTSAALAASQSAVLSGGIVPPEGMQAEQATNLLGSAYAITYLYGTFGVILLLKLCPKLIGKSIAAEAALLEGQAAAMVDLGGRAGAIRAWKLTSPKYIGKGIADLEAGAATHDADKYMPALIEKVLRDGQPQPLDADLELQKGDVVAVWATPGILVFATDVIGDEVTDNAALAVDLSSAELVLTNKELEGRSLADLVRGYGRGVTIERMARQGHDLPLRGDLGLVRGDVIFVSGPTRQVERFGEVVGYVVTDQQATDLVTLGLFLAVFGALGTISVNVAGIKLSILGGVPIGAMLGGAVLGWLRSRSPRLGTVSEPAADALASLGLALFIAAVAIGAGGSLLEVLKTFGISLIVAGAIVTTICTISTFMFGHFVLKMNVAENAGATCGAMTSGSAIGEVIKDAKSSVPAIAFALPSALNNVVFTIIILVLMKLV
jgi:putative transport protein